MSKFVITDEYLQGIIDKTKREIEENGGLRKLPQGGCCAAAEHTQSTAPIVYTGEVKPPAARRTSTEQELSAAALALGITRVAPAPKKEERLKPAPAPRRLPVAPRPVAARVQGGTELRYSHRALERLVRADLVARGNVGQYQIQFDELGAVVREV